MCIVLHLCSIFWLKSATEMCKFLISKKHFAIFSKVCPDNRPTCKVNLLSTFLYKTFWIINLYIESCHAIKILKLPGVGVEDTNKCHTIAQ